MITCICIEASTLVATTAQVQQAGLGRLTVWIIILSPSHSGSSCNVGAKCLDNHSHGYLAFGCLASKACSIQKITLLRSFEALCFITSQWESVSVEKYKDKFLRRRYIKGFCHAALVYFCVMFSFNRILNSSMLQQFRRELSVFLHIWVNFPLLLKLNTNCSQFLKGCLENHMIPEHANWPWHLLLE